MNHIKCILVGLMKFVVYGISLSVEALLFFFAVDLSKSFFPLGLLSFIPFYCSMIVSMDLWDKYLF